MKASAHLGNYVGYISTREGVDRIDPGSAAKPATRKQAQLVRKLLRDFPSSRDLFEYEDYQAAPTRGNASEFITRVMEDNYEQIAKRENYVDYIANRPRVEKLGVHGLFNGSQKPLVLSQVADEVAQHPGVVWLPIISLRREDAARLGYDNAQSWRSLLTQYAPQMAKAMKIPWDQFRWYAAFHDEGHHPHTHMVCYSADAKSGFLTKQGITDIKSMLAKEIFRQDLVAIYQNQTQRRDELVQNAGEVMERLVTEMQSGTLVNQRIEQLMTGLAQRLQNRSGKKQYGYLPPALKSLVDEVVNELAKDPRIAAAYDLWYEQREEVLKTYKDDLPERIPLSQQKEFKRIRNIVVEEAVRLGELAPPDVQDQTEFIDEPSDEKTDEPTNGPANETTVEPADEPTDEMTVGSVNGHTDETSVNPIDEPVAEVTAQPVDEPANEMAEESAASCADEPADRLAGGPVYEEDEDADPFDRMADHTPAPHAQWTVRYRNARQLLYGDKDTPPDPNAAFSLLLAEANTGNAMAMADLGRIYTAGLGRDPDTDQAQEWYAKALTAFLGAEKIKPNRYVEYRIGKMYAAGLGTEQDYEEAVRWLTPSADAGYMYAQYTLAGLYRKGQGVEQDDRTALELYTKASDFPYAAYELGQMYRDGVGCEVDGERADSYFHQAFIGFQRMAKKTLDDKLPYRIGWMLLNGVGTDRDEAAAVPWLEKAVERGNSLAKYRLGKLLLCGESVPKDVKRALDLLTQCAEDGNQFAQYTLGKVYLLGQDVPRDQERALYWLRQSAEQGNQYAQYFLDRFHGSIFSSAASLLYHMGRIFQEQNQRPAAGGRIMVESKLRQKIREKKIAMGHKPDDHEDEQQMQ